MEKETRTAVDAGWYPVIVLPDKKAAVIVSRLFLFNAAVRGRLLVFPVRAGPPVGDPQKRIVSVRPDKRRRLFILPVFIAVPSVERVQRFTRRIFWTVGAGWISPAQAANLHGAFRLAEVAPAGLIPERAAPAGAGGINTAGFAIGAAAPDFQSGHETTSFSGAPRAARPVRQLTKKETLAYGARYSLKIQSAAS